MAAVALFTVAGMNLSAQVTAEPSLTMMAPAGVNAEDTVTIGSVMPYRVSGDVQMHQLRAIGAVGYSDFTKTVSVGGTMRAASGASGSSPAAADSAISVIWNVLGTQTVGFTEVPTPVSGTYCAANTQTLNVVVVSRPTAAWNGAASATGCSVAGTTVTVPYTVTGTGQFSVTYRITYTSLSGATSNVVAVGTVLSNLVNFKTGTANLTFSYNVPAATYGKYDVYIENISDRIARKSFGNGYVAIPTTDFPVTATSFFSYPTPATQPINHIQNL